MAAPYHNVYVGAEIGLFKGICIEKNAWTNLNTIDVANREKEVGAMCWGDLDETQVCFGLQDGSILVYDSDTLETTDYGTLSYGEGKLRGLTKYENKFITCAESGLVKLWAEGGEEEITSIDAGADLFRMRQNQWEPSLLSTGGKENDLKIWDLQQPDEPIFKAKNVRHDWLDLRVPVWVTDMQFLPGSQKIVTCTGHHQVRVYDPSTPQRRPVMDMVYDEYPLQSMSLVPGREQVIVGNTHGSMALIDLRKGSMVHQFKNVAGAIRCIQTHSSLPLVASCGLDRYLRIHDINTKQLLHKYYLKSRLNCLLFASKWDRSEDATEAEVVEGEIKEEVKEEEELDELWDKLDTVKTTKRKSTDVDSPSKKKRGKKRGKKEQENELVEVDEEITTEKKGKSRKRGKKKKSMG